MRSVVTVTFLFSHLLLLTDYCFSLPLCTNMSCTDTPFLASCRCRTCVGHRNGDDSPDSSVRRVSSFFFCSPTRADAAQTRLRRGANSALTRLTRQQ
uniref:Secreted protein n=1 Tax=Quercus lobata TaxID=97700 RepID=A0A7N2KZA6_QUELO